MPRSSEAQFGLELPNRITIYYNELHDNIQKVNFSEVKFQEVNIHLQVH